MEINLRLICSVHFPRFTVNSDFTHLLVGVVDRHHIERLHSCLHTCNVITSITYLRSYTVIISFSLSLDK